MALQVFRLCESFIGYSRTFAVGLLVFVLLTFRFDLLKCQETGFHDEAVFLEFSGLLQTVNSLCTA